MTRSEIEADIVSQLKQVILHELKIGIEPEYVQSNVPLLEGGLGLDSITLFEFITLVEKRFGVTFPVETLGSDAFASLEVVAGHLRTLIDNTKSAGGTP